MNEKDAACVPSLGLRGSAPFCLGALGVLSVLTLSVRPARAEGPSTDPTAPAAAAPTAPAPTAPAPAAPAPAAPAPTAPAPATSTPAPAVPPAPAPAPAPILPSPGPPAPALAASAPPLATSPGEAIVHVAVSHRDAWLETRSYVDGGPFIPTCRAPCDLKLLVEGREARVVAPGMTTSNIFRFDAGSGVAGVRVDGGSASARRAGIISLAVGIPLALAGMALFASGRVKDSTGLEAAGIAGLAAGGVSLAISLPLLLIGSTHVKNAKGSHIAAQQPWLPTL